VGQAKGAAEGSFTRWLAHPDAHPSGIFAMPDVSSARGIEAYAAALNYLAERYGAPDQAHGRIHHWILHNEVDAGWVWTNAGEKPAAVYLDLYHKSMRMAHLIARQYYPHAQAFISLTHHWAKAGEPRFYPSRELLDLLLDFSRREGDFAWAIAYHPYPQDLGKPRTWEDDQPRFAFDSPKITFRNLEVLDQWMVQPRTWYLGRQRRTLHLTEQGLNSPDYSEKALRDQAAGMAYTMKKVKQLGTIESFHYHNWIDNRGEGGLRIGLRRFPDDAEAPLGKKPIWNVFQATGTPQEDAVFDFAKEVIGLKDWSSLLYRKPIQ
jgi:hypothetical protein